MLRKPIKKLEGKKIAIVAMGNSQLDYHMAITHSEEFDETWVINAMVGVIPKPDRAFVMDPVSRFIDTDDAGDMTKMMRKVLPKIECPIYTCELDKRVPALELYPIESLVKDTQCGYINNTVAYAIAFAYWNKVGSVSLFGADFTYKQNLYFAEMGRGCCEFWLAKCMDKKIEVSIAVRSNLLDANIDVKDKLYGYHRLNDPIVSYVDDNKMNVCKWSEVIQQNAVPFGISGRNDPPEIWLDRDNVPVPSLNGAPEPKNY
jgi:hypothetical protein|tara:strand:- start:87 stop:866 length:780 start_codon:yes stop_codon:yes gene_type:complete